MSDTVLVTGAAGFLGSHVVEALLARGHQVVGLDNFDSFYSRERKEANIRAGLDESRRRGVAYGFVAGDVADPDSMLPVLERARAHGVIHLAARAGVRPSLEDPVGYARTNVLGTQVVLDAAQRSGCRRVILASSSSVYGNNPNVPFAETDDVNEPISPYAATKRAMELLAFTHWKTTAMPTACLRFFTVFGPRQRPDLAVSRFLSAVGRGEPIEMFGDGSTSRDYTYVDDVVAGIVAAYDRIDGFGHRVWNLGSDRPVRLDEMVRVVGRVAGREPMVQRRPMPRGDVERTWADLGRSSAELGYRPTTAFEDGVRRQWAWMREQGAASAAVTAAT